MNRPIAHGGALLGIALAAWSLMAPARALELAQLLGRFAQQQERHASFVEMKYLAILDQPVRSSGTLVFKPPSRMEKQTLEPKPESLVLDGDVLSIRRDGKELRVDLKSHREVLSFVEAIRGVLMGDQALLQREYQITLDGDDQSWNLLLVPNDRKLAEVVRQIRVSGAGGEVLHIEYVQSDGDRSAMQIVPAAPAQAR